jgi:hypothetical protein
MAIQWPAFAVGNEIRLYFSEEPQLQPIEFTDVLLCREFLSKQMHS